MATYNLIPKTSVQWQIFLLGLLLGAYWGGLSILFGQYVLKLPEYIGDSHFALPTWGIAKYFVPVGMAFGIALSGLYFLQNTSVVNNLSIKQFFKHGMASVLIGFSSLLIAELLAGIVLMITQTSLGVLPWLIAFMVASTPAVLVSIIPVGLIAQPLISLIWQKWFNRN